MALPTIGVGAGGRSERTSRGGRSSRSSRSDRRRQDDELNNLLALAQAKGGATAQVVNELTDPNISILSSIGNKAKKAFSTFVDVISVPNQVIAGTLSDRITIKEAIEQDISASDVVLGVSRENQSTMSKIGDFTVRTAIDILLDPLTYVSFGATRGVLGVSSLSKVKAGKQVAASLGVQIGDNVALTEAGGKAISKYAQAQARGMRNTFLKDARVSVVNGLEKSGKKFGVDFTESDVLKRVKEIDDATSDAMIKDVFGSRLSQTDAYKTVANLLERKPELWETWLDKGGIKFFGKSMVSSQRIRNITSLIPGWSMLDEATKPFRNAVMAPFNRERSLTGRTPDNAAEIIQNYGNRLITKKIDYRSKAVALFRELGITKNEADFITAATDLGQLPSDERLASTWASLNNIDKINARPELVTAQRAAQRSYKENLKLAWASGSHVIKRDRYIPHLTMKESVRNLPFSTPVSTTVQEGKFAGFSKFIDQDTGEAIVGFAQKEGDDVVVATGKESPIYQEAGKYNSVEEFVNKEPSYFHATKAENVSNIEKQGFSGKMGDMSKASGGTMQEGVFVYPEKSSAEVFGKNFKNPSILETKVNGKIYDANTNTKYGWEDNLQTQEIAKDPQIINQLKKDGYVGVKSTELGTDAVFVFDKSAIKTKSQLIDIWNKTQKGSKGTETLRLTPEDIVNNTYKGPDEKFYKRERIAIDEANKLGANLDGNTLSIMVRSRDQVLKETTARDFLKEISENAGLPASQAPDGWVPADIRFIKDRYPNFKADAILTKTGEEIYFHPETARRIQEFTGAVINDEVTNNVLEKFDKLNNLFKASVTTVFPAFHGRNGISNVFLNYLDIGVQALNPTMHAASGRMIWDEAQLSRLQLAQASSPTPENAKKITDILSRKVFTDKYGYDWTFGEMRGLIKEHVIAFNSSLTGAVDLDLPRRFSPKELHEELFPSTAQKLQAANPLNVDKFMPFQVGRKVGNLVEEQARLVNFLSNLRFTGDPELAARQTKQFLFDYQNLSKFEKTVMRRIIPFYTFTRKNLELQAKTLFSNPGRIAQEIYMLDNLGDVISSSDLTKEEQEILPDYIKDNLSILVGRKGEQVQLIRSLGTPIEAAFNQLKPNNMISAVTPLARLPAEMMTGFNFYQGKPISEVTNATQFKNWPSAIQDFIGYTEVQGERKDGTKFEYGVSLRPERMHLLLNLPPTSRVFSALRQMSSADVSTQNKLLEQLLGIPIDPLDLGVEAQRREQEQLEAIQKVLSDAGVGYTFQRFNIRK